MEQSENNVWKRNAWGKAENKSEPIVCFADVMSEDLIESLTEEDKKQEEKFEKQFEEQLNATAMDEVLLNTEGMTDEEIAIELQRQFDREADVSRAIATSSAVTLAPERYHPKTAQNERESDEEDDDELRQIATDMMYAKLDEENLKSSGAGAGAASSRSTTTTKHDSGVNGLRNADKTFNDRMNLKTGDMVSGKINNRVYNSLLAFGKTESKRQMRMKDKEEKATMDTSVDANTRLFLLKWINQGVFDSIEGIIATGKESAVLHAQQDGNVNFAIKVYKTTLSEFKNRSEYVKDDFRFKNPRGVLRIWAEREFMNLSRMTKNGLPCPKPIKLKKNLLVMSMIGDEGLAAPRLKNVEWAFFTDEERRDVYDQVQQIMCRMYKECLLVHGDLSEFNLLLASNNQVFVIDVSQAMDLSHPRNLQFLTRDIQNVLAFFTKIETPSLPTDVQLFNLITELDMKEDDDLTVQVEQFSEENRAVHLRQDKARPADLEFKKYEEEKKLNRGISPAREYN